MLPKQTAERYILSSSPHAHAKCGVSGIMLDVLIALAPALGCSLYFFGLKALFLVCTCIATCVTTEAFCRMAMHRQNSVGDLSAVVTGLLLAFNLPPDLPLWMAVAGGVFAIGVAKQVFGGLGYNPFNPALAARAFMLISFTGAMTTWTAGHWTALPEAMTTATPLFFVKNAPAGIDVASLDVVKNLFIGNTNGCLGETSALALLAGACYLLFRKVITWHIPVAFIGTVFVYALISGGNVPAIVHVLSGGVVLGACFMATDYVTSPITAPGKLIFGAGCGVVTMAIRTQGGYPEGVSFAILVMNAVSPLIDRWTQPKPFGAKKK